MAPRYVNRTALGAAICRLIEQYQPQGTRLFIDPVVKALVGRSVQFLMQLGVMRALTIKQMDAITKGIYGTQVCRTRYIDNAVQTALAQGNNQLVLLGAGYDTRPYRLPGIERVKVYEVDLPAVQDDKRRKLHNLLGRLPENVSFIPIDFDIQTLEAVLASTAFNHSEPSVFIWEGVTQYVTDDAIGQTLSYLGKSAAGSTVLFTYILRSVIERRSNVPGADRMMDSIANYAPWVFGLDPEKVSAFLQGFTLTLIADVGNAYYQQNYLQPIKRDLVVFEGERIAHATKAG